MPAYQAPQIDPSSSFDTNRANEAERRGWGQDSYDRKNLEPVNYYDFTRKKLNFEIKRGEPLRDEDGNIKKDKKGRTLYATHPKDFSDDVIEVIAKEPVICRHIHLPVQNGSTAVLKAMNRRYTREQYLSLVERIKARIPEVSLTTDIMMGFPGETVRPLVGDWFQVLFHSPHRGAFHLSLTVLVRYRSLGSI